MVGVAWLAKCCHGVDSVELFCNSSGMSLIFNSISAVDTSRHIWSTLVTVDMSRHIWSKLVTEIFLSVQVRLRGPFLGHQEQVLYLPVWLREMQALSRGHCPGAKPPCSTGGVPRTKCRLWGDCVGKLIGLFWGLMHVLFLTLCGVFISTVHRGCVRVGVWFDSLTGNWTANCLRHNYADGAPKHRRVSFWFRHEIYGLVF